MIYALITPSNNNSYKIKVSILRWNNTGNSTPASLLFMAGVNYATSGNDFTSNHLYLLPFVLTFSPSKQSSDRLLIKFLDISIEIPQIYRFDSILFKKISIYTRFMGNGQNRRRRVIKYLHNNIAKTLHGNQNIEVILKNKIFYLSKFDKVIPKIVRPIIYWFTELGLSLSAFGDCQNFV